MDPNLKNAAFNGSVDELYQVIGKNPHVLEDVDKIPFVETPFHIAASRGHINFAVEILRLKPCFSKKLDEKGLSPMHIAIEKRQTGTVLRLLKTEDGADLVRVKGRDGKTPLHYVVEHGDLKLLHEFLSVNPGSITDTTNRDETALHIAVEKGNIEALKALVEYLRKSWNEEALCREERVVNWEDQEGCTVLHVAARKNQLQMMKLLLECNIDVNARTMSGLTVLDIVTQSEPVNTGMKDLLIGAGASNSHSIQINDTTFTKQLSFKTRLTFMFLINVVRYLKGQKTSISTESRDALLVAAALAATVTFQAVLSPPGGLRQADSGSNLLPSGNAGKVVMEEWLFIIFIIFNSASFWATIIIIFILLPHGLYGRLLTTNLSLLSACYLFSSTVISPTLKCAVVNLGLFALFIISVFLSLLLLSNRRFFLCIRKYVVSRSK
ncbi:hypothetical protein REPUB_Repub07fG0224800 [Reevesia pubescens]